jgi:hypothetical protein
MSEDWKAGDLAVCVSYAGFCGQCEDDGDRRVKLGRLYTVTAVIPYSDRPLGLDFAEAPIIPGEGYWCSCSFRKPDQHEPCEAEFVTLLKRKQVKA